MQTHTHTNPPFVIFYGWNQSISWPNMTLIMTSVHPYLGKVKRQTIVFTVLPDQHRIQMELSILCARVSHSHQRHQCNVRFFPEIYHYALLFFYWFLLAPCCLESLNYKLPSYYYWDTGPAQATPQLFIGCVLGLDCLVLRINYK